MVLDAKLNGMKTLSMEMGSQETMKFPELSSLDMYSRVKLRASDGRVYGGKQGKSALQNGKSMNAGYMKSVTCDKISCRGIRKKMEDGDSTRIKKLGNSRGNKAIAPESATMAHLVAVALGDTMVSSREGKGNRGVREGHTIMGFDCLNSMSDEGTALEMLDAMRKGRSKTFGSGYEVGDLVWGKVKSHPWWPGQIFNEAFASSSVCNMKKEGHVLVSFYGDSSYGWLEPTSLVAFDPYYAKKLKQTDVRAFLVAVEEAVDEVNRRAALGLACCCRNHSNFRSMKVQGYFEVDVSGYESGGVYSLKQIERARDGFQPSKTLSFVKKLALMPQNEMQKNIKWLRNVAKLLAYRKAVFKESDETYAQAFGVQPVHPVDSTMASKDQGKMLSQAPWSQPMISKTPSEIKGSVKPVKVKDPKMKDKCISQQRDEQNVLRVNHLSKDSDDHVLPKRAPLAVMKFEFSGKKDANGIAGRACEDLNPGGTGKDAITVDKKSVLTKVSSVDCHMYMIDGKSPTGFSVGFPKNQSSTCATGDKLSLKPGSFGPNLHQKREVLVDMKLHRVESFHASQGFHYPSDEKHCISDCQEERCMKRPKLLHEMKSLAAETKASTQNPPGIRGGDRKRMGATVSTKTTKDSLHKQETLTKIVEPTMLLMNFPPRTTMPSVSELKARFGRFGPLNQSATRVFWKSSTCHVVFDNEFDAQAAYSHAVQNRSLFGNRKVKYHLQALKVLGPQLLESGELGKWLVKEAFDEFSPLGSMKARESVVESGSTVLQQQSMHPRVQQNSCLKKSLDNDMGSTISIPTKMPRAELVLDGNGNDEGEQFLLSNTEITTSITGNFSNVSESTFCTTVNDNIESFQKAIPPALPPHLALPSKTPDMREDCRLEHLVDVINMKYRQIEARNCHSYHTTAANISSNSIDISHQMLSLLKNCSDIVSDLK